jgi:hypothetical protein
MYKVGDKVVCIDNDGTDLKLYRTYTVSIVHDTVFATFTLNHYSLEEEGVHSLGYPHGRFVLLTELRKQKIEKICSRLVT